jgi:hypothetical protein
MHATRVVLVLVAAAVLGLGGCPWMWSDGSSLYLLHASDETAYFEHYVEWSGFDVLPSTIWKVDLASGESTRVADAGVRYDTQGNADYFASEQPTNDNQGSRVVATRISTGHEIVVLERDIELGGRYDSVFALLEDRVVALADNGVLVYDLSAEQVDRTIAVTGSLQELLVANEEWALVSRVDGWSKTFLLVNLTTDEVVTIPDMDNGQGLFSRAVSLLM